MTFKSEIENHVSFPFHNKSHYCFLMSLNLHWVSHVKVKFYLFMFVELAVSDRRNKKEIRHLEQELPKWQVLVDSVTGNIEMITCLESLLFVTPPSKYDKCKMLTIFSGSESTYTSFWLFWSTDFANISYENIDTE